MNLWRHVRVCLHQLALKPSHPEPHTGILFDTLSLFRCARLAGLTCFDELGPHLDSDAQHEFLPPESLLIKPCLHMSLWAISVCKSRSANITFTLFHFGFISWMQLFDSPRMCMLGHHHYKQWFCYQNWSKLIWWCFDPLNIIFIIQVKEYQGDLTDVSAQTQSLVTRCTHSGVCGPENA